MKMADTVHLYPHYLTVDIEKPMFVYKDTDTVRVSKTIVDRAIHAFFQLLVKTPNGEKVFWPKEVKKTGKKVKEVFLYPDNPLVLFEIEIPHSEKTDNDKWIYS